MQSLLLRNHAQHPRHNEEEMDRPQQPRKGVWIRKVESLAGQKCEYSSVEQILARGSKAEADSYEYDDFHPSDFCLLFGELASEADCQSRE
jgi:hypothetical protein